MRETERDGLSAIARPAALVGAGKCGGGGGGGGGESASPQRGGGARH